MPNLLESLEGDLYEHADGALVTDEDGAPCCCGGATGDCCVGGCGLALQAPGVFLVDFDYEIKPNFSRVQSGFQSGFMVVPKRQQETLVVGSGGSPECFTNDLLWFPFGTGVFGTGNPQATIRWGLNFGSNAANTRFQPIASVPPIVTLGELPDPPNVGGRFTIRNGGLQMGFVLGIGGDTRSLMWVQPIQPGNVTAITLDANPPTFTACNLIEWTGIDARIVQGSIESLAVGSMSVLFHAGLEACGESAPLPANCERCRFPLQPGRPNCENCAFCNGCG